MRDEKRRKQLFFHPSSLIPPPLLGLFVPRVLAAAAAELAELKTLRGRLLILSRHVITTLAFSALKHNVITRHKSPFTLRQNFRPLRSLCLDYSTISEIVPAPTVLPPSRMANLNPFSIAIGVINSISIATLSPGITISTPSCSFATPVTSVVRK